MQKAIFTFLFCLVISLIVAQPKAARLVVRSAIKEKGIQLISYKDLAQ